MSNQLDKNIKYAIAPHDNEQDVIERINEARDELNIRNTQSNAYDGWTDEELAAEEQRVLTLILKKRIDAGENPNDVYDELFKESRLNSPALKAYKARNISN